jgi:hypothetical protein
MGSIDLSSIFQPLSSGTDYPTATGYKIPNGQNKLILVTNFGAQ